MSKQQVRAHLLDTLMAGTILPPLPMGDNVIYEEDARRHNAGLRQILDGATCIEATNVARFFDSSYVGEGGAFDAFWTDLKCLVPPYKRFFIEWEQPFIPNAKRMGTLFAVECADGESELVAKLTRLRGEIGADDHAHAARLAADYNVVVLDEMRTLGSESDSGSSEELVYDSSDEEPGQAE